MGGMLITACDDSTGPSTPSYPNKLIVLENPEGGETFKVGDVVPIKWKFQGENVAIPINSVRIDISWDNGISWGNPTPGLNSLPPSVTQYDWTVPETINDGGDLYNLVGNAQCKIRVIDYSITDDTTTRACQTFSTFKVVAK